MSSNLRIGGLASGMDIDQIVKDLMKVQRMKVDRIKQDKQVAEWQRDDYRDINNSFRTLRDNVFNMKLQGTYLTKKAASSNEANLTATAGTSASSGIYSVKVHNLASGISKGSQTALPEESNADGTAKKLNEQFTTLSGTISFELSGSKGNKAFTFDTAQKTIYDVVSEINAAKIGIVASYDATLNRFYLNTESTGNTAKIQVVSDPNSFLSDADGLAVIDNKLGLKLETGIAYNGIDATVDFGDVTALKFSTNTFTVNGINVTAKKADPSTSVDITVSNDTDAVFNSIKSFIELYNTTIDKVNAELSEERYRDYLPLTDEQREQLSDDQEKQWEEKAKSGLLKNDPLLSGVVDKMRSTMSTVVPGVSNTKYDSLAEIGITTGDYSEKGKLYINETKLKDALNAEPQSVMELFTKVSDNYNEKGLAVRLYDDLENAWDLLLDKAGSSSSFSQYDDSIMGKRIEDMDKEIDKWEDRLVEIEDRYWRQFTAMERAINQMNSQSAWLAQQFGRGM
ncbi:MAG: flagellar filament capping protein FliD [Bacillota bacterium]